MATSTQANFDKISEADAHAQGLDGGLNLKTDSSRLAPPATTRADNAWYSNPGNVSQLPPFAASMQPNTSHIYNVHPRDLQQPSTTGDVMVHGEVADGNIGVNFTSPVWSDGNGATINTQQPMPPWTQRTKILSGRYTRSLVTAFNTGLATDTQNLMAFRQEAGFTASAPQRYGLAYHDGTNLFVSFGLQDGQVETADTLVFNFPADYVECAGVQGTNYWACVSIRGATITINYFDFKGAVARSAVTLSTQAQTTTANALGGYGPFTILQHAGRTQVIYLVSPAASGNYPATYDLASGVGQTMPMTAATGGAYQGFSAASPYSHQAPPSGQAFYCTVQFCNQVYLLSQTAINGTYTIAGNGVALSVAPQTGYNSSASPKGTVNWQSTMAMTIHDSNGGYGTNVALGCVVFRHYPEQVTTPYVSTWYQSLTVDRFSYNYISGMNTGSFVWQSIGTNYVRMPSGVALCSKAWLACPPEANFAGPTSAKSAYVLIRCGAFEPYQNLAAQYQGSGFGKDWTYSQPTYFVVDHLGRIVARAFESQGPLGTFDGTAYSLANQGYMASGGTNNYGYATQPLGLGAPLISSTSNDLSCLDVVLPCWVQTQSNPLLQFPLNANVTSYTPPPTDVVMQPGALTFSVSSQAVTCPPVQAGPYSVLSGPMTCVHDGRGVVEANFHFGTQNIVPSGVTLNGSANIGPSGTYFYVAVWEWTDSLGRVHRAKPSKPVGAYFSGNFGNVTINIPPPVTVKTAVGGQLLVRLYRSLVNNTSGIYYQISTQLISAFGLSNQYVAVLDSGKYIDPQGSVYTTSGPTQIDRQPRVYIQAPYPTGNLPFESTMPPAFIWQCGVKGRSFGLAQVMGQHRLYYSSVAQDRYPFEWNPGNYAPIPPDLGDVRSVESIDDKLIIFGTRMNAVMNGDGPSNGAVSTDGSVVSPSPNDGFSLVQPVPTPAGVLGSGTPARIPEGIVFQGFSGVQLLGRDLQIQPIGAAVDTITGRQIGNPGQIFGRAVTLPSLQSVVFCSAQGAPLVYNYLTQKWSQWPALANAVSMAQRLDGGIAVAIQPVVSGKLLGIATALNPGSDLGMLGTTWAPTYQGTSGAPGLVLESPWILPSGESGGESQLWDVTVTGSYIGPHILQVEQAYNYVSTYTSTTQFQVTQNPGIYQYRVRPKGGSRLWAVRYRITLLPITSLSAAYLMATLGDLVLNYGTKQGTSRLSAAASG